MRVGEFFQSGAPLQPLENGKIIRTEFVVIPPELTQLSSLVVVSVKMCISLVPSHLTAEILIVLRCTLSGNVL